MNTIQQSERQTETIRFVKEKEATDPWLFGELARLRGYLDDMREGWECGDDSADPSMFEALAIIRGIEVEFYGASGPQRDGGRPSAKAVEDASGKRGPARRPRS